MKSRGSFLNPDEDSGIWVEARDKLYRFLIASYTDIASEYLRRRAEYRSVPEVSGRTLELWLPIEVILRSCGMGDEMVLATRNRFLAQYGFAEPEPSELDVAVIQAILDSFGSENVIRLSPQVITKSLDSDLFPAYVKPPQRATRVGWVITNFNLSSDKKRSKGGVSYVFEKTRVEDIYAKYFSTSPTPDEQNDDTTDDSDDVGPPLGDTPV